MKKLTDASRIGVILLVTVCLAGCGPPPDRTVGQFVVPTAPIALLIGLGLNKLFIQMWKRPYPDLTMSWKPSLAAVVGLAAYVGAMEIRVVQVVQDSSSILWIGLIFTYLPIHLLTVRLMIDRWRSAAFTWGPVIGAALFFGPAVPMAAGIAEGYWSPVVATWMLLVLGPAMIFMGIDSFPPWLAVPGIQTLVLLMIIYESWKRTGGGIKNSRRKGL